MLHAPLCTAAGYPALQSATVDHRLLYCTTGVSWYCRVLQSMTLYCRVLVCHLALQGATVYSKRVLRITEYSRISQNTDLLHWVKFGILLHITTKYYFALQRIPQPSWKLERTLSRELSRWTDNRMTTATNKIRPGKASLISLPKKYATHYFKVLFCTTEHCFALQSSIL